MKEDGLNFRVLRIFVEADTILDTVSGSLGMDC